MQKVIIYSLIFSLLTGCSLWKKEADFTSLYNSYVSLRMESLEKVSSVLGYSRQEEAVGKITASVLIPVIMSGSLVTDYMTQVNHTDMNLVFENMKAQFESVINTGNIEAKKITLRSKLTEMFVMFEGLKTQNLLPAEAQAIFDKYSGKWLSYIEENPLLVTGMSEEEKMATTVIKNISRMGIKEIKAYLLEYPILASRNLVYESGSLKTFAVVLDREKSVSLAKKLTEDLTGSGMTDELSQTLTETLREINLSGTMTFDTDNTSYLGLNLELGASGTLVSRLTLTSKKGESALKIESIADATMISYISSYSKEKADIIITASQSGSDLGQIKIQSILDDKKVKNLKMDVTVQGLTASLTHMNRDDDSFEGKLLLPVGTMMWSGKIDDHSLKMFTLKGSTPIGTIDMNLVEDGEFIRGPLMVKQGDSEILQANVGLKMKKGNFGFDIDVLTPEGTGSALKTILDVTYNSKKFTDSIDVPSPVTAFSEFLKELETIVPKEELPILMDSGSAIQ